MSTPDHCLNPNCDHEICCKDFCHRFLKKDDDK